MNFDRERFDPYEERDRRNAHDDWLEEQDEREERARRYTDTSWEEHKP